MTNPGIDEVTCFALVQCPIQCPSIQTQLAGSVTTIRDITMPPALIDALISLPPTSKSRNFQHFFENKMVHLILWRVKNTAKNAQKNFKKGIMKLKLLTAVMNSLNYCILGN